LPDVSNCFCAVNELLKMQRNSFDKLKLSSRFFIAPVKNPLRIFPRGLYNFAMMPVCP